MTRTSRALPLVLLTLYACAPIAPAGLVSVGGASSPLASAAMSASPLASPSSLVPTPTPPPGGLRITTNGHLAPKVGDTVAMYAQASDDTAAVAGATWTLDPQDALKAKLVPATDGSNCDLEVHLPGTLRVTATIGAAVSHLVLVATTNPVPSVNLTASFSGTGNDSGYYMGPYRFPGDPAIIRSATEWTRYWQAVSTYSSEPSNGGGGVVKAPLPTLPSIDFSTASLVVLAETFGDAHETPVIASVDASGTGLVQIGLPEENSGVPNDATEASYLQVFQVAKLPATAVISYDCRSAFGNGCASPDPLPSPDAFLNLSSTTLVVNQGIDLPTSNNGLPLTWTLGASTAAHASLTGNHLTPISAGGLVLQVSDGVRGGTIFDAIQASTALEQPINSIYGMGGRENLGTPRFINTQADWTAFWNSLWGGAAFDHVLDTGVEGSVATVGPTGPPPPPDAPVIDFTTRTVLALNVDASQRPVLTSVDATTIHLVIPAVSLPDQVPASPTASPVPGQPVASALGASANSVYVYNLPKLTGTPTVVVEPLPAGQAQ